MKTLIVVRHAKSSWANIGQSDFDRSLNDRGKADAPKMAERLLKKNIVPDIFVSSPALRAKNTCKAFCEVFNVQEGEILYAQELYHAPEYVLYNTVSTINNNFNIAAIFAHNPGITDFVNSLCNGMQINNMPTCGIFAVRANTDSWKEFEVAKREFLFFDFPKNQL